MFSGNTPISRQAVNYKIISEVNILNTLEGNYDTIPSVYSYTSLPIVLTNSNRRACTFPNKRYSFYTYNSRLSKVDGKYYDDKYYDSLEQSPYPYGYEEEECFSKHSGVCYEEGLSNHLQVNDRSKYIECIHRYVKIRYLKKSNKLLVRSYFTENPEESPRFVFFKQTKKLKYYDGSKIKWNSSVVVPSPFLSKMMEYLKENDTALYKVLVNTPTTVRRIRTVLNNTFWKDTGALYLLSDRNTSVKRRVQSHYRKNKYVDFITLTEFPDEIKKSILLCPSFPFYRLPMFLDIYKELVPHRGEKETIRQLCSLIYHESFTDNMLSVLIQNIQDIIKYNADVSDCRFIYSFTRILSKYSSMVNLTTAKTVEEVCQRILDNNLQKDKRPPRKVLNISNNSLIISPNAQDVLNNGVNIKSLVEKIMYGNSIVSSEFLYKGILVYNKRDLKTVLTFGEVLENSEILFANQLVENIIKDVPQTIEEPSFDDLF